MKVSNDEDQVDEADYEVNDEDEDDDKEGLECC